MSPAQRAAADAARAELDAPRLEERIPCCDAAGCDGNHYGMRGVRVVSKVEPHVLYFCERCVRRMTSELWGGGLAGGAIARGEHTVIDHTPLVDPSTGKPVLR